MSIENDLPACPHCHLRPALVAKSTRRCTNCGKSLDSQPTAAKEVIQVSHQPRLVSAMPAYRM